MRSNYWLKVIFFGLCHLIINAIGVSYLYGRFPNAPSSELMLYNFLAYAIQPFLGLYIDLKGNEKILLYSSLGFASIIAFVPMPIWLAGGLFGLCDAIVIICGAAFLFKEQKVNIIAIGVYCGLGSIGIGIGSLFTKAVIVFSIIGIVIVGINILNEFIFKYKFSDHYDIDDDIDVNQHFSFFPIIFILGAIILQGYVRQIATPLFFRTNLDFILIYFIVAIGKVFGGALTKIFGIKSTIIVFFLPSIIFLSFLRDLRIIYMLGIFLFNISTAISIYLMMKFIPDYKTLVFGLNSGMLLLGLFVGRMLKSDFTLMIIICIILMSCLIILAADRIIIQRKGN